jgi:hypothetical protein
MSVEVIVLPKSCRLSDSPKYHKEVADLAHKLWEEDGRPHGSRESYYYFAQKDNPPIESEMTVQVEGYTLLCYYEFRFLTSLLPCSHCQMDDAHYPQVRLYRVREVRGGETLKMTNLRLWPAALKEVLRIRFAGGALCCYRKKCQKERQRQIDFMRELGLNQTARRS